MSYSTFSIMFSEHFWRGSNTIAVSSSPISSESLSRWWFPSDVLIHKIRNKQTLGEDDRFSFSKRNISFSNMSSEKRHTTCFLLPQMAFLIDDWTKWTKHLLLVMVKIVSNYRGWNAIGMKTRYQNIIRSGTYCFTPFLLQGISKYPESKRNQTNPTLWFWGFRGSLASI